MSPTDIVFDDGRGQYTDVIRARAPRGLRDQVKEAAKEQGMSLGEFVRMAINDRLANAGRRVDPQAYAA